MYRQDSDPPLDDIRDGTTVDHEPLRHLKSDGLEPIPPDVVYCFVDLKVVVPRERYERDVSRDVDRQSSLVNPQSSILNPQSSILKSPLNTCEKLAPRNDKAEAVTRSEEQLSSGDDTRTSDRIVQLGVM
jgi:hypothetical protein